jgi:hypothetical protein
VKFAIARWTMSGFFPAFQAITRLDRELRETSGRGRGSPAPAPARRGTPRPRLPRTRGTPSRDHRGKVQSAVSGEPGAFGKPPRQEKPFPKGLHPPAVIAMPDRGRDRVDVEPAHPRSRALDRRRKRFSSSRERRRSRGRAGRASLEHVFHDSSVRAGSSRRLPRPGRGSLAGVLQRLAESKTPQHLIAVVRRRDVAVSEILAGRPGRLRLRIQDPGNLGRSCRVGEAAGAAGIVSAPGTPISSTAAVRGSAAASCGIPVSGKFRSSLSPPIRMRPDARSVGAALAPKKEERTRSTLPCRSLPSWSVGLGGGGWLPPAPPAYLRPPFSRSRCGNPWIPSEPPPIAVSSSSLFRQAFCSSAGDQSPGGNPLPSSA